MKTTTFESRLEHPLFRKLEARINDIHPVKGVSKLDHSIQMADRVAVSQYRPAFDCNLSHLVTAALFHDAFGDTHPDDHGFIAALALKPYVPHHVFHILQFHADYMKRYWENTPTPQVDDWALKSLHKALLWFTDLDWASFEKDYRPNYAYAYLVERHVLPVLNGEA